LDEGIRESSPVDLEGSVIILDEAHNIESACRDATSLEFLQEDLKSSISHFLSPQFFLLVLRLNLFALRKAAGLKDNWKIPWAKIEPFANVPWMNRIPSHYFLGYIWIF